MVKCANDAPVLTHSHEQTQIYLLGTQKKRKEKYAACVSSVVHIPEGKEKEKKTRKDKKNQAQSLGSLKSSFTAHFADLHKEK